jgi:hypothetical protein
VSNGVITNKLFSFETNKRKKKEQNEDKEESNRFERTSYRMEKENGKMSTRICGQKKRFFVA